MWFVILPIHLLTIPPAVHNTPTPTAGFEGLGTGFWGLAEPTHNLDVPRSRLVLVHVVGAVGPPPFTTYRTKDQRQYMNIPSDGTGDRNKGKIPFLHYFTTASGPRTENFAFGGRKALQDVPFVIIQTLELARRIQQLALDDIHDG
jgi:hypothetical protein